MPVLDLRREQEPLQHLRRRQSALRCGHLTADFGNAVEHPLVGVQVPALLGEVADFYRLTDFHRAAVRGQTARNHVQQRGLARAVVAHNAQPVFPADGQGEIRNSHLTIVGFGNVVQCNNLLTQPAGLGRHLHRTVGGLLGLVDQGVIPLHPVLAFGGPGPAAPHNPLPFPPQQRLTLSLRRFLHLGFLVL